MRNLGLPATVARLNYRAAIIVRGDACMPKFNWRSLDDAYYNHIEKAEMTGIAWECLRRNTSFQRDQSNRPAGPSLSAGFRQHWGLVFRS